MLPTAIPSFVLYGDEPSDNPPELAHIETIAARSALHHWEIAPHRHTQIVQALLVTQGQVEFRCDRTVRTLSAPCFMVVPIGSVHGFRFTPETSGYVLSLSAGFMGRGADARDPLLHLLTRGGSGSVPPEDQTRIEWLCAEMLSIQADWRAPEPLFLALAEALVRSLPVDSASERQAAAADEQRLSAFRRLVELHLRHHHGVAWYAAQLRVTPKTLTRICRRLLDCTPMDLLHARLVQEAQRLLMFTSASIVQVADDLGFSDSSYFSRFYSRMTGRRPNLDKAEARAARPGARQAEQQIVTD